MLMLSMWLSNPSHGERGNSLGGVQMFSLSLSLFLSVSLSLCCGFLVGDRP
jgi:hypothetical protein